MQMTLTVFIPGQFLRTRQCTDQMVATDLTIHDAVSMYLLDESMGKRRYGPIDSWDTSDVTDMSELFCSKAALCIWITPKHSTPICPSGTLRV